MLFLEMHAEDFRDSKGSMSATYFQIVQWKNIDMERS